MGTVQMTWPPSLVKLLRRKPSSPPLGLKNQGNSCYLNSVLQCLTYTPPLAEFCLRNLHSSTCDVGLGKERKGECPFCILEKRIVMSLSSESVADTPVRLNNSLRIYADHFRSGRQEDAHEFLRYVIDACHNTCLRLMKLQRLQKGAKNGFVNGREVVGTDETAIKEIFGGELQSQVKCLSCGAESNKVDEIMDVSLDILHIGSIKEALQKFFQPEVLDGNNKYKCDNCKELVVARKQLSILQAPNVLVVQLKRFEGIYGRKVDKPIAFDEILVLSNHMCKGSQDLHPEYNLFGTIVHSGFSPDSGHYYAYVKDAYGRWYRCNDSYVSVSTLQEVLSEKVYILFFSRTKQRPRVRVDIVTNGSKSHESNGSKTSITQKQQKPVCSTQTSNHLSVTNKSQGSNGIKAPLMKPYCLEKSVDMKISVSHSNTNGSTNYLASNGTKTPTVSKSDHVETPVSNKDSSIPPSVESSALVEHVNMKGTSNHDSQTGKNLVDQDFASQQEKDSIPWRNSKPLANGIMKIAVYKRGSREVNGCTGSATTSKGKENVGVPVVERNEPRSSLAILSGQNGPSEVGSSERITPKANGVASEKGHVLQNGNGTGSSDNSGLKRKREDHSCTLLAKDAKSRAEVDAFKNLIGNEALKILRSCGWSDEVHNFMHENKRVRLEAGNNNALDDHDMKKMLISDAKKKFIAKIPGSLKENLIEQIRAFLQENKSSGT